MDSKTLSVLKGQARKDLLSFCVYTDKFFEVNKHHVTIAEELQAFMEGKTKRLILQTPPRSGKSRLVGEAVAWAMGNLERTDIIYTGHSINLLEGFSRNIRGRVDSPEYRSLFASRINEGNSALNDWSTTNGNRLMIYGVGWGITGKGWNRLIIDDPYATREDAESDTIRKKVYDWYNSTFYSRRHDHEAGICLIMQRWREDDLVGEVLGLEDWKVVKIPALDENGQSFWHSRFPPEELEKIRKQIWPYFFESQYQQDPVSLSAGDFKKEMFTYCDALEIEQRLPRMDVVTFLDPAISQKQEADFTAIVTVGFDPTNNYAYLLEAKQLKETPDNIISELFQTVTKYGNAGKSYRAGIETVQYQKMLAMEIRNQMRIRDKFFNLEDVSPQGEKEARIRSMLQPRYSSRSIVHPKNLPNLEAVELELLKFPNAKHDDLIDALASALALRKANGTNQGSGLVTVDYGLSAFLD